MAASTDRWYVALTARSATPDLKEKTSAFHKQKIYIIY